MTHVPGKRSAGKYVDDFLVVVPASIECVLDAVEGARTIDREAFLDSGVVGVGYEVVKSRNGRHRGVVD